MSKNNRQCNGLFCYSLEHKVELRFARVNVLRCMVDCRQFLFTAMIFWTKFVHYIMQIYASCFVHFPHDKCAWSFLCKFLNYFSLISSIKEVQYKLWFKPPCVAEEFPTHRKLRPGKLPSSTCPMEDFPPENYLPL